MYGVFNMDIKEQIINKILNHNVYDIAIVVHNNPDADAIGSAVALENVLLQLDKNVTFVTQNKIRKIYANIVGRHRVNRINVPYGYFDMVFVLDCSEESRVSFDLTRMSDTIVVIDHHANYEEYGTLCWREDVISNTVLIYKLINKMREMKLNIRFNKEIATALYMGLRGDSFNFRNPNVTAETHEISADLIKKGADLNEINEIERYPRSILKLEQEVWSNIMYDANYRIMYAFINKDTIRNSDTTYAEASRIIDIMKLMQDVDVAVLFLSVEKTVYIKVRSTKYDVAKVMEHYGGGGHKLAAGAVVFSDSPFSLTNSVIKKIRELIDKEKQEKKSKK
jgi:phosphoesterase RecJ-like protein